MSGTTAKFGLIYATGGDVVKTVLKTTLKTLVERLDYMLGETFDSTITPSAAGTKTTKTIAFGRTYSTPPRCLVCLGRVAFANNISAGAVTIWIDDVTTTGVVIGVNATNTTVREFTVIVRPKQGDATL